VIVEIEGKKYYDDTRLKEYRNVKDFMDSIPYRDLGTRAVRVVQKRTDLAQRPEKVYKSKVHRYRPEKRTGKNKRNKL
jgi:hypothetical protein